MDYSVFLGLLAAVLIVLLAAFCYRLGIKGMPRPASRAIAIILAIAALPAGFYVYSQRAEMRRTTLFEAIIEGSAAGKPGDPAPVHEATFVVEHPQTTHLFWLVPMEAGKNEVFDARVLVRIIDPADAVLLEEECLFAPVRVVYKRRRAPNTYKWTWEGKYFNFTPNLEGGHRVQVSPLTAGIPRIHLLVRDPLKKDGKRLPGY